VRRFLASLRADAFAADRRLRAWLAVALLLVNGSVLLNALTHDPRVAYDAGQHLRYVDVLATGRLPLRAETAAFYGPPLPYVVPALVRGLSGATLRTSARAALLVQAVLSIVLTLALLVACQRLRPGDGVAKLLALGLCGMPAVYYRTFAMLRGEPYLATLATLLVAVSLGALARGDVRRRDALAMALTCAGIALSRQLGALLLLGWGLFALVQAARRVPGWGRALTWSVLAVALLSGWFYVGLRAREGTAMAWNLPRVSLALGNQPSDFFLGTGSGELFTAPGRPRFQKQLLPVLHADWWGDYWHYFLFHGRRSTGACVAWPAPRRPNAPPEDGADFSGNYDAMLRYLGLVNALALLPAAVLIAGLVTGARAAARLARPGDADDVRTRGLALVFLMAVTTGLGYLWFVVSYPRPDDGDTVKATYVFQLVPLLALLGAEALVRLRALSRPAFRAVAALLVAVALVVAPTWHSRWRPPLDCLLASSER
jgi:hypothetical protein